VQFGPAEPFFPGLCCIDRADEQFAHEIALRVGKDAATTEDLRTAMIHYRSLFEELVQVPATVERKEVA
jgi:hypothetical protein